ncbi:SDR family NAD(P)-dependent oxidoreductase, partial [Amycolatopsis pretoriensis]
MRLDGKIALITGAARGQGEAAARAFVAEGAKVLLADILDDEGKQLAAELGERAVYQHLDVGDEDGWAAAVDRAATEFGAPNVL